MAVIEVTYEKYAELVEKELDWIRAWLDQNFKSHLSILLMSFIPGYKDYWANFSNNKYVNFKVTFSYKGQSALITKLGTPVLI